MLICEICCFYHSEIEFISSHQCVSPKATSVIYISLQDEAPWTTAGLKPKGGGCAPPPGTVGAAPYGAGLGMAPYAAALGAPYDGYDDLDPGGFWGPPNAS